MDGRSLARAILEFHERIAPHVSEWALMFLPLAAYLLVMGSGINRRRHPVVARGSWNLAGVFLGSSGFLLLGPPTWAAGLFRFWGDGAYWLAYGVYLVLLLAVCAALIRRQARNWVIYNIDPACFAQTLHEVLENSGLAYTATPGRISFSEGRLILDIDSSHALSSVSLRWRGEGASRDELEPRLLAAAGQIESEPSGIGLVMTATACLLFAFAVYGLALYVFFVP